ncbi:GntR family transcriptional regulator [Glaciihabitans arcticus]|uniref:GntR family transcriptional regulator n=1 Tax=Glaciihabitans arcticus TaxID=2668039 RepID=A0A4Q9GVI6_9MICO|nr:GntR family transcriptional regulator [Glaciihabitans arcticus]TBN58254.1 GntR family transcriptional regulator [Glaciihabitans arcticus]
MATSTPVLPETIYDDLRSSIIAQQQAPGSLVTESSVASRFGVSRQTAKVAIERLVAEGVLRREAHRAARVPLLTVDDIVDLFDNRALVESAAVSRLASSGILPSGAIAAHRALLDAAASGERFADHDVAFHRALVLGAPSPRLARLHELLLGEIELCIGQVQAAQLLTATEVGAQHQGILDAVLAGDSPLASRLIEEHIAGSRDRLVASSL